MNTKSIATTLVGLLVLLLGTGCSQERALSEQLEGSVMSYPVRFSLEQSLRGVDAATTTTLAARENEKKVDALTVVAFNVMNTVERVYRTGDIERSGSDCLFDMKQAGTFTLELLANASDDLIGQITPGLSHDNYLKLVEKKAIPAHGQSGFVMTSLKSTRVTAKKVDKTNPTDAGTIKLRRLAARFDFYSRVDGFTFKSIRILPTATRSALATGTEVPTGAANANPTAYTTSSGDWFKTSSAVGGIYSYENPEAGATKIEVVADYKGKEWKREIEMLTHDGQKMSVKRNHLYRLTIGEAADVPGGDDTQKDFTFNFEVVDWDDAIDISYSDRDVYNSLLLSEDCSFEWTPTADPTWVSLNGGSSTISLFSKVTDKSGKDITSAADKPLDPKYVLVELVSGPKEDVTIEGTKVTIAKGDKRDFVFRVTEKTSDARMLKLVNGLSDEQCKVTITRGGAPLSIQTQKDGVLSRMAEYNVKADGSWDTNHTIPSSSSDQTYLMDWNKAMSLSVAGYHLPSRQELQSVFPWSSSCVRFVNPKGKTLPETITGRNDTWSEEDKAKVGDEAAAEVNSQFAYDTKTTYALRFIGTDHESAWKYEYVKVSGKQMLRITAIGLKDFEGTVKDVVAHAAALFGSQEATVRLLPAAGYSYGTQGSYGSYWSATESDSDSAFYAYFSSSDAYSSYSTKSYSRSVRLFAAKPLDD